MLRIGAVAYPPLAFNCSLTDLNPSETCELPGIDHEILGYVLHFMNISYQLIPFYNDSIEFGRYEEGSWNGLLKMVHKGELDTVSTGYIQTPKRTKDFSFVYPNDNIFPWVITALPKPTFFETSTLVFRVFDVNVWLLFFASFILLSICLVFLVRVSPVPSDRRVASCKVCWDVFRLSIDQGTNRFEYGSWASNSLIIWLCVGAVLMLSLYQGMLNGALDRMAYGCHSRMFQRICNSSVYGNSYEEWKHSYHTLIEMVSYSFKHPILEFNHSFSLRFLHPLTFMSSF